MAELQRIRRIINWLIFAEYAQNEKELAKKLGYTQSAFSQITNGKVPLSNRFIQKLCSADENINYNWILTGRGNLFKKGYQYPDTSLSEAADKELQYEKTPKTGQVSGGVLTNDMEVKMLLDMLKERDHQMGVLQSQITNLIELLKR